MKASARYAKIVEWSAEDNCYVGSAPGLILGGCHGDDEQAVFEELCQIVDEAIALYERDGKPLPPPTSGRGSRPTPRGCTTARPLPAWWSWSPSACGSRGATGVP